MRGMPVYSCTDDLLQRILTKDYDWFVRDSTTGEFTAVTADQLREIQNYKRGGRANSPWMNVRGGLWRMNGPAADPTLQLVARSFPPVVGLGGDLALRGWCQARNVLQCTGEWTSLFTWKMAPGNDITEVTPVTQDQLAAIQGSDGYVITGFRQLEGEDRFVEVSAADRAPPRFLIAIPDFDAVLKAAMGRQSMTLRESERPDPVDVALASAEDRLSTLCSEGSESASAVLETAEFNRLPIYYTARDLLARVSDFSLDWFVHNTRTDQYKRVSPGQLHSIQTSTGETIDTFRAGEGLSYTETSGTWMQQQVRHRLLARSPAPTLTVGGGTSLYAWNETRHVGRCAGNSAFLFDWFLVSAFSGNVSTVSRAQMKDIRRARAGSIKRFEGSHFALNGSSSRPSMGEQSWYRFIPSNGSPASFLIAVPRKFPEDANDDGVGRPVPGEATQGVAQSVGRADIHLTPGTTTSAGSFKWLWNDC
jgi:hypothetical protein